jgi:hypothetical protein
MEITGYRKLADAEVDLINSIKALANDVGAKAEQVRGLPGVDGRWASIGITHLQEGFMALIRSIAKPDSF